VSASTPQSPAAKDPGAAFGRRFGIGIMHSLWRPRVLGGWRVPASGPLILAVNHSHYIDGPLLMGTAPRPVHFLIKKEVFTGPVGAFLRGIGQVPVDRNAVDRTAISEALRVLDDGHVLGIFPEGTRAQGDFSKLRAGLAYFAVRSGAPIVPVAVLGSTDTSGRLIRALPALRSRVDVVFGDAFTVASSGPRRAALDDATLRIQERLTAHLKDAKQLTDR
jgi:1-acyl-sn-glycerol-3-phosphate acyltransferase